MKQQNTVLQNPELVFGEQQHIEINLSYYDLVDAFTGRQAACLIAGIDPNMQDVTELCGSPEFARMRAAEDGIEQAYEYAKNAVWDDIREDIPRFMWQENPPWLRESRNVEKTECMLPSIALLNFWQSEASKANRGDYHYYDQKFMRDDISRWLKSKKFHGARYFLPVTSDNGIDPSPASPTELALRAEIEQLQAEIARLQANLSSGKAVPYNNLSFRHETDLLKLVAKVQDKFLGPNFDNNDPDTNPRKDNVVEWLLKQNPSLSKPSAEAIDRVAMPFKRGK